MKGANTMTRPTKPRPQVNNKLSEVELNRIAGPAESARLSGCCWETLKRTRPDKVIKISPRRVGMRLRDVLMIES